MRMPVTVSALSDRDVVAVSHIGSRTLSRSKRWIFRLLALFLGTVLSVVALEIILRVAGWPAPGFYIEGRGPMALRRPGLLGGAYPPNAVGRLKNYEYD